MDWFAHADPPIEDEPPGGVAGGVEVEGIMIEGEPRANGLIDAISKEEAPEENDLGEGTAEPVEAYRGRSSSGL